MIRKEEVKELIRNLQSPQWLERKNAAEKLVSLGERIVPYLEKTFQFENEDVRYWVTIVLAKIGGKGIQPLIKQLKNSPDKDMRIFAAKALGEAKAKEAIIPLIESLSDKSWNVRKTAAESLKNIGKAVVKPLVKALQLENEDIKFWAIKILGELGAIGLKPLITILERGDVQMKSLAAEALGDTLSADAVPYLIKALASPSWSVRKNAAKSLEKLGDIAIPDLVKELDNPNPDVRYWIVRVLGNLGKKAVGEIISHLEDRADQTRIGAQEVFYKMGKDAIEPLIHILKNGDKQMRKNAAEALGNTKDPKAIPILINALGDSSWFVRKSAALALEEFGHLAIEDLTKALESDNEDIQFWATRILAKLGIDDYRPLLKIFKTGSKEARYFVLEALAKSEDEEVVRFLISALSDKSWPIRKKAAELLVSLGERSLIEVVKNLKNANNDIRYWCIQVLRGLGEISYQYLEKELDKMDVENKLYAIYALGELKDERALSLLSKYLDYSDEWIRRTALEAIISISPIKAIDYIFALFSEDGEMVRDDDIFISWILKRSHSLEDKELAKYLLEKYHWFDLNSQQKRIWLEIILKSFLTYSHKFPESFIKILKEMERRDIELVGEFFLRSNYHNLILSLLLDLALENDKWTDYLKKYVDIYAKDAKPFLKRKLNSDNENLKELISKTLIK